MPRIELITDIAAPPQACFDAARDLDLHQKSMGHTGEAAIAGRTTGLIELGEEVTWRGQHFGFMLTHTAKVTAFSSPDYFRDEMTEGKFKRFIHDHYFEPTDTGTRMRDIVDFASPFGPLGWLVDQLVMEDYLRKLLEARNRVLQEAAEMGL